MIAEYTPGFRFVSSMFTEKFAFKRMPHLQTSPWTEKGERDDDDLFWEDQDNEDSEEGDPYEDSSDDDSDEHQTNNGQYDYDDYDNYYDSDDYGERESYEYDHPVPYGYARYGQ